MTCCAAIVRASFFSSLNRSTAAEGPSEDPTLVYPHRAGPGFLQLLTEGASEAISRGLAEGVERVASRARDGFEQGPVEVR